MKTTKINTRKIQNRLEYLRKELRGQCISYGELIELQSLSKFIDANDIELLEAAGITEFKPKDMYRVRLLKGHTAKKNQIFGGYLGRLGEPYSVHYQWKAVYKKLVCK